MVADPAGEPGAGAPIELGGRLEPTFVDRYLIDRLEGASLRLHPPQFAGTVLRFDRPWEGPCTGFFTVLHDADLYRMYYVGLPFRVRDEAEADSYPCYA